jgi:hypothetical protein
MQAIINLPAILGILCLILSGCSSSDGDSNQLSTALQESVSTNQESNISYDNADGAIIGSYGKCYLKDFGNGKRLLHLEGSDYEMGYAMGYLLPNEVRKITSLEYYVAVVDLITGGSLRSLYIPWIEELAQHIVAFLTDLQLGQVPAEYIHEMQGVVDGVNAATPDQAKLQFNDVVLLNMANDVMFTFLYKINALGLFNSCNGFVVTGKATSDGRTLMGRHFMYPSVVFYETALLIEYKPDTGNPFISVGAPGFVGVTAAMNSKGIAIGMDVLKSGDTNYFKAGMGTLLTARRAIQYTNTLDEAIDMIQRTTRGVPWFYIIGDGSGKGAVIESTTNHFAVRYLDSSYPGQIEYKDDVVAVTNHALVPEIIDVQVTNPLPDTYQRYTEMTHLLLDNYGKIDTAKGREIIDFLHPGGAYSWEYGTDPDLPVSCSVTLFDLSVKEVWSLFGKYSDPWVHYKLPY